MSPGKGGIEEQHTPRRHRQFCEFRMQINISHHTAMPDSCRQLSLQPPKQGKINVVAHGTGSGAGRKAGSTTCSLCDLGKLMTLSGLRFPLRSSGGNYGT